MLNIYGGLVVCLEHYNAQHMSDMYDTNVCNTHIDCVLFRNLQEDQDEEDDYSYKDWYCFIPMCDKMKQS